MILTSENWPFLSWTSWNHLWKFIICVRPVYLKHSCCSGAFDYIIWYSLADGLSSLGLGLFRCRLCDTVECSRTATWTLWWQIFSNDWEFVLICICDRLLQHPVSFGWTFFFCPELRLQICPRVTATKLFIKRKSSMTKCVETTEILHYYFSWLL